VTHRRQCHQVECNKSHTQERIRIALHVYKLASITTIFSMCEIACVALKESSFGSISCSR
jgi:hypothetical protein